MARYIDADELICKLENNKYAEPSTDFQRGINAYIDWLVLDIKYAETADVVLKSEVDRLVDKWIGEENLTQDEKTLRLIEALRDEAKRYERYYFNHEYDKLIAEAKQEVVREIFDGIGKLIIYRMIEDTTLIDDRLITDIAEFKKKYVESENNNL